MALIKYVIYSKESFTKKAVTPFHHNSIAMPYPVKALDWSQAFGGVALEGSERRGWDFLWFYTFKIYLTLAGFSRTLALSN